MKDKIYTKEEAEGINRKEQIKVLRKRDIAVSYKDKEPDLIRKILASNPKPEPKTKEFVTPDPDSPTGIKEKKNPCEKCGKDMIITGGGPSGTDFHCDPNNGGCGYKLTRGA